MLGHAFTQSVQLIPTVIDGYRNVVYDSGSYTTIKCKFRNILSIDYSGGTNIEGITSDAMAWFAPDTVIQKGDIIIADGDYFRVEKIVKARKMVDATVQFLKVSLQKHKQVVS